VAIGKPFNLQRPHLLMHAGMALRAERDQVLLGVVARMAAKPFVVDFQVRHRAARLTPPAVAPENLLP
jgi:hypothetical protein